MNADVLMHLLLLAQLTPSQLFPRPTLLICKVIRVIWIIVITLITANDL